MRGTGELKGGSQLKAKRAYFPQPFNRRRETERGREAKRDKQRERERERKNLKNGLPMACVSAIRIQRPENEVSLKQNCRTEFTGAWSSRIMLSVPSVFSHRHKPSPIV